MDPFLLFNCRFIIRKVFFIKLFISKTMKRHINYYQKQIRKWQNKKERRLVLEKLICNIIRWCFNIYALLVIIEKKGKKNVYGQYFFLCLCVWKTVFGGLWKRTDKMRNIIYIHAHCEWYYTKKRKRERIAILRENSNRENIYSRWLMGNNNEL